MKRYIFGFFIFAAMGGAALSEFVADADGEMLQGEWALASIEVRGKTLPAPLGKGGSLVLEKDGKLILKDPGKPDKIGKYKLDTDKIPAQIDLFQSKDGEAMKGIYELDGDKLKMAFSAEGSTGKRPSEFKGAKVLIVLWKRQKS